MKKESNKLTKRQFLKQGLLGTCGLVCLPATKLKALDPKLKTFPPDLWKWSKEAMFYVTTPRGVKCMICPNECSLKPDELSDCRNRINKDNKLYTIAYGNPCAVHVDPIEKKPLNHFIPTTKSFSIATAGCNLACLNCQNWTISQTSPTETENYDLMPQAVVDYCLRFECESIAYTYSEPLTFYEYTLDTAKIAKSKGIKNVLVSAGYILEEPLRYLAKYIDGANIDLKSFSDNIYLKLNGGKLEPILNTLRILKEEGVWLEITNLIVPTWTDDFNMIREMCKWLFTNGFADSPLHFSRFHPTFKLTQLPATPVSVLEKARNIALDEGIKFVYIGNVPGTTAANTYCPRCKQIIIERKGYQITRNNLNSGKCNQCGEPIPGVWN